MNIAYNEDCLPAMRAMPDNAFDLAVVDPPYGDGLHAEDGGGKSWFTKYNQKCSQSVNVERERERESWNRFGGRFDRYKLATVERDGQTKQILPPPPICA